MKPDKQLRELLLEGARQKGLSVLPEWVELLALFERLILRTFRLAFGLVIGLVGVGLWPSSGAHDALRRPLMSLSITEIANAFLLGLLSAGLILLAFYVAFGPRPHSSPPHGAMGHEHLLGERGSRIENWWWRHHLYTRARDDANS